MPEASSSTHGRDEFEQGCSEPFLRPWGTPALCWFLPNGRKGVLNVQHFHPRQSCWQLSNRSWLGGTYFTLTRPAFGSRVRPQPGFLPTPVQRPFLHSSFF